MHLVHVSSLYEYLPNMICTYIIHQTQFKLIMIDGRAESERTQTIVLS